MKKIIILNLIVFFFTSCDVYQVKYFKLTNQNKFIDQSDILNKKPNYLEKYIDKKNLNAQFFIKPEFNNPDLNKSIEVFKLTLKKKHPIKYFLKSEIKYRIDSTRIDINKTYNYCIIFKNFTFYRPFPNGREVIFFYSNIDSLYIYYEGIFGSKF